MSPRALEGVFIPLTAEQAAELWEACDDARVPRTAEGVKALLFAHLEGDDEDEPESFAEKAARHFEEHPEHAVAVQRAVKAAGGFLRRRLFGK